MPNTLTVKAIARAAAVVCAVCVCVLALSCSVNQSIAIRGDGSGSSTIRVEVAKPFIEYVIAIAEVAGFKDLAKQGKIFDPKEIQKGLEARPGVTVKRIASPSPETLEVEIAFASIRDIFGKDETLRSSGVVTFGESNGQKTLKFHLDRANFKLLSTLAPMLSNPVFEGLGPQLNDTITEAEYLDMIAFSLGEGGPALVKKSAIEVTVRPEGQIVAQTGGLMANGSVVFRIPLLRLLILDKPLDYSVTFK